MRLRLLLLVLAILLAGIASSGRAQVVPNGGFESWTADSSLVGWETNNTILGKPVTPTTPAHSGNFALKGTVLQFFTYVMPPALQSGVEARGFGITGRPAAVSVWYKFFPVAGSGDRFGINVGLFNGSAENGTGVAIAAQVIPTPTTVFTKVTVPFNYFSSLPTDTCVAQFLLISSGTAPFPQVGSYYILDDVALEGTSDVDDLRAEPRVYSLAQNYPNPFNPATSISFTLAKAGYTTLRVFDVVGHEVARLVDGQMPAGEYKTRFDGSRLSSGFYLYRLESGGYVETRRMVLVK